MPSHALADANLRSAARTRCACCCSVTLTDQGYAARPLADGQLNSLTVSGVRASPFRAITPRTRLAIVTRPSGRTVNGRIAAQSNRPWGRCVYTPAWATDQL